ncbi:MAG: protein-glutamate O-methyltransferase CheR [Deltaproteobacteria bacterium]|nr:protein-glutamate O-methyltransferase CheR [Deltaproteobacteria bacterium]
MSGAHVLAFEPDRLRRFAAVITRDLGIMMPDAKLRMLHGWLQRRLNQLGLASLDDYEARLQDPAERVALIDLATTNKTDFFREPQHFAYLVEHALPALSERDRWTCRVWCAGCSTGEEVYTLAMVLDDYAQRHPGFAFELVATDISTRVLRQAVRATYPEAAAEPIPEALRTRYLRRGTGPRAGFVRVVPALRAKVRFGRLNFMAPRYAVPGPFDVIFFRNVMIYFDRATQAQVIARQCEVLRPGGYLFVGHSESVLGMDVPLAHEATSVLRRVP